MELAAWIIGITGQDGSYLAELLLDKGYRVWGTYRHSSCDNNLIRINHIRSNNRLHLAKGDLTDEQSLRSVIRQLEVVNSSRIEVYNLAAQSFVELSFQMPETTINTNCNGLLKLLECLRNSTLGSRLKVYHASSSEMYGKVIETPQTETTPFYPRSPYGVSKVFGYWLCKNYREGYGMYISNGILFNHESPRRGEMFVTRKITKAVSRISAGSKDPLYLGNLDAKRDWGHAKDYVEGMWRILQHSVANDWVLSSNETHSVREFAEKAFLIRGITLIWEGSGIHEIGKRADTGEVLVRVNPALFRPTEVEFLLGDSSLARKELGWVPTYSFLDLVTDMVNQDCA